MMTNRSSSREMNSKIYKEYQPIAEPLDLVWRYDQKIFGEEWQDWVPNLLSHFSFDYYRMN